MSNRPSTIRIRFLEQTYLSNSKEYLDIDELFFRQGGTSILDLLDEERTYRATQLACRQQLAAYLTNPAQLEAVIGTDVVP